MAVVFPIEAIAKGDFNLDSIVVEIYYGFFTLFFLGILLKISYVHEYCAFVNSLWIKSLFYIFCASLAFAQLNMVVCWVVGCCFAVGSVLNMIRCCGGQDDINAGSKK